LLAGLHGTGGRGEEKFASSAGNVGGGGVNNKEKDKQKEAKQFSEAGQAG